MCLSPQHREIFSSIYRTKTYTLVEITLCYNLAIKGHHLILCIPTEDHHDTEPLF